MPERNACLLPDILKEHMTHHRDFTVPTRNGAILCAHRTSAWVVMQVTLSQEIISPSVCGPMIPGFLRWCKTCTLDMRQCCKLQHFNKPMPEKATEQA